MEMRFVTRKCPRRLTFLLTAGLVACLVPFSPTPAATADGPSVWETWTSASYTLAARESIQLRFKAEDVPARRWKLVVDGGDWRCDLSVLRYRGEELVYFKTDETRHEVMIPWGTGEELNVTLTNRPHDGSFVVSVLGPPQDQLSASYAFEVNRALEAFSSGQRLKAEKHCRAALLQNPEDGVAKVLLAGFQRDRQFYEQAAALVEEALAGDLPGDMQALAEHMRTELVKLRAPLPKPVRDGIERVNGLLAAGQPDAALAEIDHLLDGSLELDGLSHSRLLTLRGRSLEAAGRNFEAVEDYTAALGYARAKKDQAQVYFHMGQLYLKMGNRAQAQGAFTIALQNGLPSGLEIQARDGLQKIEKWLDANR